MKTYPCCEHCDERLCSEPKPGAHLVPCLAKKSSDGSRCQED